LYEDFADILKTLQENPFEHTQGFEKLVPPDKGFYSRRLTGQHRVVYKIDKTAKSVTIICGMGSLLTKRQHL
jgi:Txe/YoeB family toxin of toxin-antitoxin system